MKLSEWKLYSIYALGHILQGSPEADEKYLKILFKYLMGKSVTLITLKHIVKSCNG